MYKVLRTANTYDWIIATADSKIKRRIWAVTRTDNNDKLSEGPTPPNNVNNKWPAIMLAANRIANVPGRITFLIVSINTINGIRAKGVPWGTKWANICLVCWSQPKIINVIHKGNDKDNVIAICLDLVKT